MPCQSWNSRTFPRQSSLPVVGGQVVAKVTYPISRGALRSLRPLGAGLARGSHLSRSAIRSAGALQHGWSASTVGICSISLTSSQSPKPYQSSERGFIYMEVGSELFFFFNQKMWSWRRAALSREKFLIRNVALYQDVTLYYLRGKKKKTRFNAHDTHC